MVRGFLYHGIVLLMMLWQLPVAGQTSAFLTGGGEICSGDSASAVLTMSGGKSPFTVVINYSQGEYRTLKEVYTGHIIWLKPLVDETYHIASVEDADGVEGTVGGSVTVTVLPVTAVDIILDTTAYLKTEPGRPLVSDPPGADFYGYGVVNNSFYPGIATPNGSPYDISCIYTNESACESTDTVVVHVIHGVADVKLYDGNTPIITVCDDELSYEIRGTNKDQMSGTFKLSDGGDTAHYFEGYIVDEDTSDNIAILNTSGLMGTYLLEYVYKFDVLSVPATEVIHVNNLEGMVIEGLPEIICNGDGPYPITAGGVESDPGADYTFSGAGVSGNQSDGYFFNPREVALGSSTITLKYTSSNGCSVMIERDIQNFFSPDASFTFTPACLAPEGGKVSFNNITGGTYAVESWAWDFGDPGSETNTSIEKHPDHFYSSSGGKQISLTAYTADGCISTKILDTMLVNQPVADFIWLHDCFIRGDSISLLDRSASDFSEIKSLVWTLKTESGGVLGSIMSNSHEDTIRFPSVSPDDYLIQLEVSNLEGCPDTEIKEISLSPTIHLTSSGYYENFNSPGKMWRKVSDDLISSWVLDLPDFTGYDPAPGDLSWFTDLPDDTDYLDRSWIESPCFDFTSSSRPFLQMDLMKSFLPGVEGAVLQYSEGYGAGWVTLGNIGEGTNWYNVSGIVYEPGGSDFGWGSEPDGPDQDWVGAKIPLDIFLGNTHVKFRIVVATGGTTGSGNQGFAFDNFSISEMKRRSVLEHFTNSSQGASKSADDVVDAFSKKYPDQVIDLQYHVDYPGHDYMNQNNAYTPSVRSRYYGVPAVPYSVFNGRDEEEYRFDFSSPEEEPGEEALEQAAIDPPKFSMDMVVNWLDESLEVTTTTSCDADSYASNMQLYVVVMESSVTAYTGLNQDTVFRNVVLDMLPSPSGKLLGNDWQMGDIDTRTYAWDYPEFVEDIEDLVVVAFVLDRENREILQATASYLTPPVGIRRVEKEILKLSIYPNPASEVLNINLGERAAREGRIEIMDLSGRIVMESELVPGYAVYQVQISSLPQGIYMICWFEEGQLKGRNKLVRTR